MDQQKISQPDALQEARRTARAMYERLLARLPVNPALKTELVDALRVVQDLELACLEQTIDRLCEQHLAAMQGMSLDCAAMIAATATESQDEPFGIDWNAAGLDI